MCGGICRRSDNCQRFQSGQPQVERLRQFRRVSYRNRQAMNFHTIVGMALDSFFLSRTVP